MVIRGWLVALLVLASAPAGATHDPQSPVTDYSAYTLRDGEIRMGPGRLEYGLFDTLDLGTLSWLWYIGLLPAVPAVRNLHAKWRFLDGESWALAATLGVGNLDLSGLGDEGTSAQVWLVPLELLGSWRTDDFTWNLGLGYTLTRSQADASNDDSTLGALLDLSVGYVHPTVEWRLGPVLALVLESRIKLFQTLAAGGATEFETADGRTKIEVFGNAKTAVGEGFLGNVSLSCLWSWPHVNLRAGLGYGHYAVPGLHLFFTETAVFPELGIFWRF